MRAVRFDAFGGLDVLEVREVDDPVAGPDQVLVRVRAAAINPGEIMLREGVFADRWPTTFPSRQGSDLAGAVEALGEGVTAWAVGDEVLGWTDERASHAELVVVPGDQLARRPSELSWPVAGSMFVAPLAAWACIAAVAPQPGDVVVVSGAAGGVGSVAVQLARRTGATVVGLAGAANHAWLREQGVVPVAYGDGQAERLRAAAPDGIDAFIDTFGGGYVDLALALGVAPERVNTIIDFTAVERLGVQAMGCDDVKTAALIERVAAATRTLFGNPVATPSDAPCRLSTQSSPASPGACSSSRPACH